MAFAWQRVFLDDFTGASFDDRWTVETSAGRSVEVDSGQAKFDITSASPCGWQSSPACPKIYTEIEWPNIPHYAEARLLYNKWDSATDWKEGAGVCLRLDAATGYVFGQQTTGTVTGTTYLRAWKLWSASNISQVGSGIITGALPPPEEAYIYRFRVYWVPSTYADSHVFDEGFTLAPGEVAYLYSSDDGVTYSTHCTGQSLDADPVEVGLSAHMPVSGGLNVYFDSFDLWRYALVPPMSSSIAREVGPYHLIGDDRDYSLDEGLLVRDTTIVSRCRARLLMQRGRWAGDLTLGSRLHTIKTLKRASAAAMIYIEEALADLINAGEIDAILPLEFVEDHQIGALGVRIEVQLPGEKIVPLGIVPLGSGV